MEEINDSKRDPPLDFQLYGKITFHIQNYSVVSCYLQCLPLLHAMGPGPGLQGKKRIGCMPSAQVLLPGDRDRVVFFLSLSNSFFSVRWVKVLVGNGSRKAGGPTRRVALRMAPPSSNAVALPRDSGAFGENRSYFLETKFTVHGPPQLGQGCHLQRQWKTLLCSHF